MQHHHTQHQSQKFEAIIYDLDNTIFATRTMGSRIATYIIDAILSDHDGRYAASDLADIKQSLYVSALGDVAKAYQFPEGMLLAGKRALESVVFDQPLYPYNDHYVIEQLPLKSFLVTSGNKIFQTNKIKSLAIEHLFESIHIDDEDEPNRVGKEGIFRQILEQLGCSPQQIIVIGDNTLSEITAGNNLGMHTIQILRADVQKGDEAKQHIHSFVELTTMV